MTLLRLVGVGEPNTLTCLPSPSWLLLPPFSTALPASCPSCYFCFLFSVLSDFFCVAKRKRENPPTETDWQLCGTSPIHGCTGFPCFHFAVSFCSLCVFLFLHLKDAICHEVYSSFEILFCAGFATGFFSWCFLFFFFFCRTTAFFIMSLSFLSFKSKNADCSFVSFFTAERNPPPPPPPPSPLTSHLSPQHTHHQQQ